MKARPREELTGHERDEATGLHYAGARYYLSAFGRWMAIDPLTDDYPSHSPYNYALNNPLVFIDPNGAWIQRVDDEGNVTFEAEEGDNFQTFMDQYGLDGEQAAEWFKQHGMEEYLPQKKGGILGWLGFEENPSISEGFTFQSSMGHLKGDLDALSDQQLVDQLGFAMRHTLQSESHYLNLGNYFAGLGGGKDTHRILTSADEVAFRAGSSRIPVSYMEFPINIWTDRIGMRPDVQARYPYVDGQPVQRVNFTFYHYGNPNAQIPPPIMLIQVPPGQAAELFMQYYTAN